MLFKRQFLVICIRTFANHVGIESRSFLEFFLSVFVTPLVQTFFDFDLPRAGNFLFGFFHDYGRFREQGGNCADSCEGRREQNTHHAN